MLRSSPLKPPNYGFKLVVYFHRWKNEGLWKRHKTMGTKL